MPCYRAGDSVSVHPKCPTVTLSSCVSCDLMYLSWRGLVMCYHQNMCCPLGFYINIHQTVYFDTHSCLAKTIWKGCDETHLYKCWILPLVSAMRETKEALENVSSSLEVLQDGTSKLQNSLSGERASLSNTLSDPACTNGAVSPTCNAIRSTLAQLGVSADFTRVPGHCAPRLTAATSVFNAVLLYIFIFYF